MIRRLRSEAHFNIIGHAKRWFVLSGILVLASIASLLFNGINAGLEFSGGTSFEARAERDVSVQDVRDALGEAGLNDVTVQEIGTSGYLVQGEHVGARDRKRATEAFADALGTDADQVNVTTIGPKWGAQITSKMLRALVIFFIFTLIYLSIRLEPKMAGVTMVALVHDLIVTAGVYSFSRFEVTPSTVIALLTVLGYSLYDTVVIFDRVKERTSTLSAAGRVTYTGAANEALNQVLLRSFNTSMISLIPVGSLLFVGSFLLGAQTLRELALALFVGLAAGTYSSVFIATPALAIWKEREDRWASLRARIAGRGADRTDVFAPPPPPRAEQPSTAPTGVAAAVEQSVPPRPAPRKRPQQRRKRKKHGRR